MHVTLPNFQDPTAAPGTTITAIAKVEYVGVGVQKGDGRLTLSVYRDVNAYEGKANRLGPLLEYQPGDGVIPPLYTIPAEGDNPEVPGLLSNPTFAAAWAQIAGLLLSYAAADRGGEVVTP